jgi:hypothetical protein
MVRWDSPLFTILWTEECPPVHQIWDSVTKGNVKPPNSGTLAVCTKIYLYCHSDNYDLLRLREHPGMHCMYSKKRQLPSSP